MFRSGFKAKAWRKLGQQNSYFTVVPSPVVIPRNKVAVPILCKTLCHISFPRYDTLIIGCKCADFAGLRRPIYFQYEMGAADTVSRTVDALLNDWAQIVHLYTIVHDLAEYFKMGKLYLRICHAENM